MIPRKLGRSKLAKTVAKLRMRLAHCEATLDAIRGGEVDALVVDERAGIGSTPWTVPIRSIRF